MVPAAPVHKYFVKGPRTTSQVLGVGLEIVPESDTGRKIFQCSFDLLSKEAFKDFGIRSGVSRFPSSTLLALFTWGVSLLKPNIGKGYPYYEGVNYWGT